MSTKAGPLLLLLTCCVWSAQSQRQSIWADPIKFNTKTKDQCTMTVTGQGEFTRLRISCQSKHRSYWCEYLGKPYSCRSYNKNPRHYFVQMMWGLRKLQNACMAPKQIKPHMCRKATDNSQMVFSTASFSRQWPEASTRTGMRPAPPQHARTQPRLAPTRASLTRNAVIPRYPTRVHTHRRTSPQPTEAAMESDARRMARLYCWRSLHGVCSYVIGLFRN